MKKYHKTIDLFEAEAWQQRLAEDAIILRNFPIANETSLVAALKNVIAKAPLRHMITPGGFRMSVAMSNCGQYGWATDKKGYRYEPIDSLSASPWPAMPAIFLQLATRAAAQAGFIGFIPDACLINNYLPGARLALHQDKDERDFKQPIVSVSLGIPADFLFGGLRRTDKPQRVPLTHGDVVVWGRTSQVVLSWCNALKRGLSPNNG